MFNAYHALPAEATVYLLSYLTTVSEYMRNHDNIRMCVCEAAALIASTGWEDIKFVLKREPSSLKLGAFAKHINCQPSAVYGACSSRAGEARREA